MHSNPNIEIKNNTTTAKRYQLNSKIARVFKWIGIIVAIIPPAVFGTIFGSSLAWNRAYYLFKPIMENPPLILEFLWGSFFGLIIIGAVAAVAMAITEKVMKNKSKWHGDIGYYLHRRIETGNSQELEKDIDEAIKRRDYALERHLQKIYQEIKEIVRTVPS
jgi:hypothetical protein